MSIYPSLALLKNRLVLLAAISMLSALVVSCAPTSTQAPAVAQDQSAGPASGAVRRDTGLAGDRGIFSGKLDMADATYIGEKACMECHEHAAEHASMGVHVKAFRSNPRTSVQGQVCEACHGPGSKHAKESLNRAYIIGYTRDWGTPVEAQNTQCLTCHQGGQRLYWVRSTHDTNNVACSDCHNPMFKNSLTGALVRSGISETCYTCHPQQRAEFLRRSHMPVPEGKMSCEDCHNPHGTPTRPLLKGDTVNEVCYACHAEKRGPFLWEHAPVRENCANCHLPHGSNNDKLLVSPRPFLCQQCHNVPVGHPNTFYNNSQTAESAGIAQAAGINVANFQSQRIIGRTCQNCHSQVHGSNHPAGARWQR